LGGVEAGCEHTCGGWRVGSGRAAAATGGYVTKVASSGCGPAAAAAAAPAAAAAAAAAAVAADAVAAARAAAAAAAVAAKGAVYSHRRRPLRLGGVKAGGEVEPIVRYGMGDPD